jgi:hypothetical protein
MATSHLYTAAVAGLLMLAGCHGDASPAASSTAMGRLPVPTTAPAVQSLATTSDVPQTNDVATSINGATALAQRAASYAKEVSPNLSARPDQPAIRMVNPPAVLHTPVVENTQKSDHVAENKDFPDPDSIGLTPNRTALADASLVEHHELIQSPAAQLQDRQVPAGVNSSAGELSATLDRRAHDYPQDLSAQTDDQLLHLVKDDQVPDPQSMAQLAPEDREVLGALLDGLTNFRNGLRQNNNMLLSQKVAPLIDMSERLRAQSELTIPTVVFVTAVSGFGHYTPLKPARFIAGNRQTTYVYFEVENFSSQLNASQLYESHLRVTRVLYTEGNGMPVITEPSFDLVDTSYRRRHDYFGQGRLVLPANLTIGRYLLKITVEDLQARRIAENTIPVEIIAG